MRNIHRLNFQDVADSKMLLILSLFYLIGLLKLIQMLIEKRLRFRALMLFLLLVPLALIFGFGVESHTDLLLLREIVNTGQNFGLFLLCLQSMEWLNGLSAC